MWKKYKVYRALFSLSRINFFVEFCILEFPMNGIEYRAVTIIDKVIFKFFAYLYWSLAIGTFVTKPEEARHRERSE